ncbi:hypothetical protein ABIA96_006459, partial [Bradyrhizobium sp. LB11.1]
PFDLGTAPITVHKDSSQQHVSFGKAAFTGGILGKSICARLSRRFSTSCRPAANGEPCPASSLRTQRSKAIFMLGAIPVGGSGSSQCWFGERGKNSGVRRSQQLVSSTAKPLRQHRPGGHVVLTPASASTDASGTSSSIPTVSSWLSRFIPPTFRMSMALSLCWSTCETAFPGFSMCLPIGFIAANSSSMHSPTAARGRSRSSSDRSGSKASSSCPDDGWSNAPLRGSAAAGA